MPSSRAYDAVVAGARRYFEVDLAFGPNTDLSSIAAQTDGEYLEWLIDELDTAFNMVTPQAADSKGRLRKLQLALPHRLSVTELADVLDTGRWPESWIASRTQFAG